MIRDLRRTPEPRPGSSDRIHVTGPAPVAAVMPGFAPFGHAVELTGMSLVALPPARIELDVSSAGSVINVTPDGGKALDFVRLNGMPHRFDCSMLDRVSMLVDGYRLELRGTMATWELFVEFDRHRLGTMAAEALDGAGLELPRIAEYQDRATSALARLAIEHLRCSRPDPLYLDGIALAIVGRQAGLGGRGNREVSTSGTERRIDRAIDYIEAHLDARLSVAELASVAIMSPTWFSSSFRARTGRSVHAWVVHRRLERARDLLRTDTRSIAEVALGCGFSSQTHLTTRFGQAYGITPARWRAGA